MIKLSRVKKLHHFELNGIYDEYCKSNENKNDMKEFLSYLQSRYSLYTIEKRVNNRYRFTFFLFFICITLIMVYSGVKWLFTGSSLLDENSFIIRKMIQWDKYCGFNII